MTTKCTNNHWYKRLWRILSNPTLDVIVAMVVVILAAWIVIESETQQKHPYPVLFGNR
jgi:membrane-bound ClpP family serine protease